MALEKKWFIIDEKCTETEENYFYRAKEVGESKQALVEKLFKLKARYREEPSSVEREKLEEVRKGRSAMI